MNQTKYLTDTELSSLTTLLTRLRQSHRSPLFLLDSSSSERKRRRLEPRSVLMISLLLATGARASELLSLTRAHINYSTKSVRITGLKGSNEREIPLATDLFADLLRHADALPQDPAARLFPITYERLGQIWREYRPCTKKLHSLRHTFAIKAYQKTRDIRLVQKALGHKNIMNTMVYQDYVYTIEEMRKLL